MALWHSEIEFFGKLHFCTSKTVDLATFFEILAVCFRDHNISLLFLRSPCRGGIQFIFFGVIKVKMWWITMYFLVFLRYYPGGLH